MPKKIKIFLTIYILIIGFLVVLYENYFGQNNLIALVGLLTILMIIGVWIFPEVVTKNQKNN